MKGIINYKLKDPFKGLCMMTGREADTNPAVLNLPWQNNVLAYSVSKDPFSLTSLGFKHSQDMVSRSFLSFTFEASLVLPVFYAWLQNNGVKLVGNYRILMS